jgi:benzylsuccinate CoA-transferase BbsF subunit
MTSDTRAFAGLKVVDFGWGAATPRVTKVLADHGATVLRVESSIRPDGLRRNVPFKDGKRGLNLSAYFAYGSGNKYSFGLNNKGKQARKVLDRLIRWGDIVTENFSAGTMERNGLGFKDLQKINPSVIMFRSCNQGQTGPNAEMRGNGPQLVALSGFTEITGFAGQPPTQPYGGYTDLTGAILGNLALLGAMDYRRRTGKGQEIDTSQIETSVHFMAPLLLDYNLTGHEGERTGNRVGWAAPHGVFRCQGDDNWLAIAIETDGQWKALAGLLGVSDSRFETFEGRSENQDELEGLISAWTADKDDVALMKQLQSVGVPAGVVNNPAETYEDPQLRHRDFFWMMDHKVMGPALHIGATFKLSQMPAAPIRPTPALGQHTIEFARDTLGFSESEVEEMLADGTLEAWSEDDPGKLL